ncbi:MAG: DUF167 domain-containing protein [Deltaproteobacteria bacterium]|nr:DUF167 domain-containing protein [Deltaproteobacteria bacterium]
MIRPKSPPCRRKKSKYPFIEISPKGVFLRVRLQPRASRNAIEGVMEGSLRIRLTAPPVGGEANRALIEFLSDILRVKKSSLKIASGLKSRDKRVSVDGLYVEEVERAFEGMVSS